MALQAQDLDERKYRIVYKDHFGEIAECVGMATSCEPCTSKNALHVEFSQPGSDVMIPLRNIKEVWTTDLPFITPRYTTGEERVF